ncbi:MAG: hypothetical protein AMXMBFR13_38940 [Phycisphaerae bacterium]
MMKRPNPRTQELPTPRATRPLAVDVHGLAELIPLSESQIELMARQGQLPCFRAGRRLLFPVSAVQEFMHRRAMESLRTAETADDMAVEGSAE